ncbi:MAG: N-6 DNA methylase [Planctomycetes bacterium]|nr:N-6 DNA methylase [Planctomycetota bacterium]
MAKIGAFELIEPSEWLFDAHGDVIACKQRAQTYFDRYGRYDGAEYQNEEFVRQWILKRLLDAYEYPTEWLGEQLVIEETVQVASTEKEADVSLKNKSRRTFCYIEAKKRGISDEDFAKAERQLETYLSATHTATIGMLTDGDRVKVIRKKVDPNDFDYIPDIPSFGGELAQKARLARELPPGTEASRLTGLEPLSDKYEKVLFDCHSAIRDIDGLHADEALDELSKLIYAKVYDERTVVKSSVGTEFRFQVFGASSPSEAASGIRELYEDARREDIELYSSRIPGYERSRGVFRQLIRLSDNALYRVVEILQRFSFVDSKTDIKGRAFQAVLGTAIRAGMGQYFTPHPVVDMAVRILQPKPTDSILDPFCGSAHFLTNCLDYVVSNYGDTTPEHELYEFKFFHLHGIEKSERMVRIAMTDMLLHDDGHTNIRNTDALLSFDNYPDILALREDGSSDPSIFSIVVTNPPFGSIMKGEVMEILGRFTLGHKRKSLPLEVLGLERSFQFLKPGGKLAIVLPDGILKNKNALFVRKWVENTAVIKAVISLPIEAFYPFGATVKTSLCVFQKLFPGESCNPDAETYLVECENLGYDATGRANSNSETDSVVDGFHREVGW